MEDCSLGSIFAAAGYVGPFQSYTAAEMGAFEDSLRALTQRDGYGIRARINRHLDDSVIAQLASHPRLKEVAGELLGPDLLLWRSMLIEVAAEAGLGWHRDEYTTFLERPVEQLAIHLAVTASSEANCVRVLPGSHLRSHDDLEALGFHYIEGTRSEGYGAPNYARDPEREPKFEALLLEPGEFVVFHAGLLHGSMDRTLGGSARRSSRLRRWQRPQRHPAPATSRWALTMRVVPPGNRVLPAAFAESLPRIDRCVVWQGEDRHHANVSRAWPFAPGLGS